MPLIGDRTPAAMLHDEERSCLEAGRLDEVQRPCDLSETQVQPATVAPEVRATMLAALPYLRAFAISLAHTPFDQS